MITIFNRKELLITNSMDKQSEVRGKLSANKIKYSFAVKNILSKNSSRGYCSTFGINTDFMYEYKIYVHKKDFDMAQAVINSRVFR